MPDEVVFIPDNLYKKVKPLVRIAKGLILGDNPTLLDVGCGYGKAYKDLKDKVDYFGIDTNTSKMGLIPESCRATEDLFTTSRSADYVLCSRVMNHLASLVWPQAIEKLLFMARKNLFLIVSPGDFSKNGACFMYEGYLVNFRPISWFDSYKPMLTYDYRHGPYNTHVLLVFKGLM